MKPDPPSFLLSKYETFQLIGSGADGQVYRCVRAGVITAVKVLNSDDTVVRSRFQKEVEILKRFDHRHIVKLLDAGETDGHLWLESEFADEGDYGKMFAYLNYSAHQQRNCFVQICQGVMALHEARPAVIHRDLKPRNILVFSNPDDRSNPILKVADFGLSAIAGESSRLTTSGQIIGTGFYMAPEVRQNPYLRSEQADIYSLGITFLEASTGDALVGENVDKVPSVFRPIIEKMIKLKSQDRYQSVRDVIDDLLTLSMFELMYGRELAPGEVPGPSFSTNTAGQLARIVEVMYDATPETIESQLDLFESKLNSLGLDIHDHKSHSISTIPTRTLKLIDEVLPNRLCRLIQQFDHAAEHTNEGEHFFDNADRWGFFLVQAFHNATYRPTRHACFACLTRLLVRFDTPALRHKVGHLIYIANDPADLQEFAACLREHNREDIAALLDGVPEERNLDEYGLKLALGIETAAK